MSKSLSEIDYSLYLVTGRELLAPNKDYFEVVEEAIRGGVSVVQVREKNCDTLDFLEIARKTKEICQRHGVPIIINDRIDIALAVDADGVHLGQTDMPIAVARKLLPKGSVVGISCNTPEHAAEAVISGADYIGIGAVWSTQTKQLTNPVIGVRGIGDVLEKLAGTNVKAVAIGGIKSSNLRRTVYGAKGWQSRELDGVAVVSEIMASSDPVVSARHLREILSLAKKAESPPLYIASPEYITHKILPHVADILKVVREKSPLIHQITNNVVINQSANATLAVGASPIMATAAPEMQDLSRAIGALLINFGTITDKDGMLEAGKWANHNSKPIVFDPVGIGATAYRQRIADELLNHWQVTVIKGNAAEIGTLAKSAEVQTRGVDSVGKEFADPAEVVRLLARRERCVVVMTGPVDWVSDGHNTFSLHNGHPMLADITGSGCMVGTLVATFCAGACLSETGNDEFGWMVKGDMLSGALTGVLALTVASEYAAEREEVQGTGTFLPALIDELYHLTPEKIVAKAVIKFHSEPTR